MASRRGSGRSSRSGTAAGGTIAPRIDPIVLGELAEGFAGDLDAHAGVEGLRFSGLDLGGRDLSGATVLECSFVEVEAHETVLRGASVVESRFERLNAPVLSAPRSRWRDVSIESSRLGSAEFYESSWQSVHLAQSKLGYVNLRGAVLDDVLFTDCSIDELDLSDARATRVAFVDCRVSSLTLTRATLNDVDLRSLELHALVDAEGLRGATLTTRQVAELAHLFAAQLGIRLED